MKKIRGLKSLVQDAVEHGSRAIERVQIDMAKTPFDLLEKIEPIKAPVSGIRLLHNAGVAYTHTMIRLVNKVTGDVLDKVIDAADPGAAQSPPETPAAPRPTAETKSA